LVLLGTFLAWGGVVDGADSIIYYVFGIVDQVPNNPLSIIRPIFNTEPMFTFAYRPLSTALLKLGSEVFERDIEGLKAFTFVHGLALVLFGAGARRFLLAHGFSARVSLLSALTVMCSSTVLWSAWTLPEFDMVGAAFVLWAGAALRRGKLAQFIPLALLAMVTKETTAALMFAYLLAYSLLYLREDRKPLVLSCLYFLCLLAAVFPTLSAKAPVSHEFYLRSDLFEFSRVGWLAVHNVSQILYSFGPAGALLLWHAVRPQRLRWPLFFLSLALFGLPMVRQYNHYEAIVFSDPLWVLLSAGTLGFGLLLLLVRGDRDQKLLSLTILLGFCGLLAGPVLASAARSDLSARLYAPLLPMMFGLAWQGAEVIWTARPHRWTRWWKPVSIAVIVCFVWQPLSSAVSQWQFWQARFPVELEVKQALVDNLEGPCPRVYYPNHNQELAIEELDALGPVSPEMRSCVSLVQLLITDTSDLKSAWDRHMVVVDGLRGIDQYRKQVDSRDVIEQLLGDKPLPMGVQLFVQTPRSLMSPEVNERLIPDFTWAETRIPEARRGTFEQAINTMFVDTTRLEVYFSTRAPFSLVRSSDPYISLPLWLHEVPQRLMAGLPIAERYEYKAALYGFKAGEEYTVSER
jgi:hypothetical protein